MAKLKLNAEWTDDNRGKKDYEGSILSVSTRYWPRGGGFLKPDPEIKPSAKSEILLYHGDDESIALVEAKFEAETEEEVQKQVEEWAQDRFDEIVTLLKTQYQA